MTLGQKLKTLLKENQMTQENLAEQLDVSRQAVGKWVTDKGIPEVEKLIQISYIFGVSLDYLLKDEEVEILQQNNGYYVSREMLDGFLAYKREGTKRIVMGIGLIVIANIFECFAWRNQFFSQILYWIVTAMGATILIWNALLPVQYKEIKNRQLLFDDAVIKSFIIKSDRDRKRYILMIIAGTIILLLGTEVTTFFIEYLGDSIGNSIDWAIDAIWIGLFIIGGRALYYDNFIRNSVGTTGETKKKRRYRWVYVALPMTIIAVMIAFVTNIFSPVMPIIVLFCALLVTTCKLLIEGKE